MKEYWLVRCPDGNWWDGRSPVHRSRALKFTRSNAYWSVANCVEEGKVVHVKPKTAKKWVVRFRTGGHWASGSGAPHAFESFADASAVAAQYNSATVVEVA